MKTGDFTVDDEDDEDRDEDDALCDMLYVVDIEGGMDDISWDVEGVGEFVGVLRVCVCSDDGVGGAGEIELG